jgi:anti-sigma-K factor RskA
VDIKEYIQSGILESYVLGLTDVEETTTIDSLRREHPEVEQAINDFSALLEKQALANAVPPPPEMKAKVMQAIFEEKDTTTATSPSPLHSVKSESTRTETPVRSIRPWKMIAAASIILLIGSAALNFYLYERFSDRNEAYQALLSERNTLTASNQLHQVQLKEWEATAKMMADPAMAKIKLAGTPGKEQNLATLLWDTRNKDVYVVANKLPQPVDGKQYQLWALVDGKPVDAGVLDVNCVAACKMKNIQKAQGFAITLEKKGGSPTPTLREMYVMGNS